MFQPGKKLCGGVSGFIQRKSRPIPSSPPIISPARPGWVRGQFIRYSFIMVGLVLGPFLAVEGAAKHLFRSLRLGAHSTVKSLEPLESGPACLISKMVHLAWRVRARMRRITAPITASLFIRCRAILLQLRRPVRLVAGILRPILDLLMAGCDAVRHGLGWLRARLGHLCRPVQGPQQALEAGTVAWAHRKSARLAKLSQPPAPLRDLFSMTNQWIRRHLLGCLTLLRRGLRPFSDWAAMGWHPFRKWLEGQLGWFSRWCEDVLPPVLAPFVAIAEATVFWTRELFRNKVLRVSAIVAVLLGTVGLYQTRPIYLKYKEHKFVSMAHFFKDKGDDAKAVICARKAVFYNPTNAEACGVLAELADRTQSPQALIWQSRLIELSPTSDNRLKLVNYALRYEAPPYPLAGKTLDGFTEVEQRTLPFNLVSARFALQLKQYRKAETHLEEAIRLDPTDDLCRMNLAVLRLQSTNGAVAQTARETLDELRCHPSVGAEVLRTLLTEYLSRTNWVEARRFSEQLLAHRRSGFRDRLLHQTILHEMESGEAGPFLHNLQEQSGTNALQAGDVANWMVAHGQGREALAWLRQLAPAIRSRQPLPMVIAACHEATQDWSGLQEFLEGEKWGDQSFLRTALLARALRYQNKQMVSESYWREAVRLASERPEFTALLAQISRGWGWTKETEELLAVLSTRYPAQPWALQYVFQQYHAMGNTQAMRQVFSSMLTPASGVLSLSETEDLFVCMSSRFASQPWAIWVLQCLFEHYVATGKTRSVYQIFSTALTHDSENSVFKNNLATVALLLRTNLPMAHQLAREVYEREPGITEFASTYAYSLHLQGKTLEAVSVMEKIAPPDLRKPALAAYYGSFLAAAGQRSKARDYLGLADAAFLLPEEKEMVRNARRASGSPLALYPAQ
jgi:tetratricopeptide (TPR) repeat protein